MNAWKRLAEALGIEDPNQPQVRQPSAFDIRRVQRTAPTGMSQRPGAAAPRGTAQVPVMQQPAPAYAPPPRPAPRSPLATPPNSPQRIGGDAEAAGMDEDEDY